MPYRYFLELLVKMSMTRQKRLRAFRYLMINVPYVSHGIIQSKDDERGAYEGVRIGERFTSKDTPRHQRSRRLREFYVRIFDTLPPKREGVP